MYSIRSKSSRVLATAACCVLAATVPFAGGCGSSDPFDYVQVSGKVTYEDGSIIPAERIIITFDPQSPPLDDQTHPQTGRAIVNVEDGTFDMVSSYRVGDGLVPGKHKVLVTALDKNENVTAAVPVEYQTASRTPLLVDTADAPFEIKVRKP